MGIAFQNVAKRLCWGVLQIGMVTFSDIPSRILWIDLKNNLVPIQTRSYSTIKMLAKIFIASSLEVINAMQKLTLIFVNMMHPTTYQNIFQRG